MATPRAYLHFGTGNEPRQTVGVEARHAPTRFHIHGLMQTASGYGSKLSSDWLVRWEGRWRRVYVCNWSNSGTAYIGKPGAWLATVSLEFGED